MLILIAKELPEQTYMEGTRTLPAEVRKGVEDALYAKFGERVQIVAEVQNFWPSYVFRCALMQSPFQRSLPKTIIVRIPRDGTARTSRAGLCNEQAALKYLAKIGCSLAPHLLAGGGRAGFLVTEDLGSHPSLLNILLGEDPEAARQGLIAFARGLGVLHKLTASASASLPANLSAVHVPVAEHWQQVLYAVAKLGLPKPQGVDADIEEAVRLLAEPSGSLALSSGDPSVVNCKIFNGSARFFDFEEACFRNPLVDATILRYPYPTGGPPWHLPYNVALQTEAAYRAELAEVYPVAQDDNYYERSMAAASIAWMIVRMARLPKVDAGPDRDPWLLLPPDWASPVPMRSRRRQLVSIIETCISSIRRAHIFDGLAEWCENLADALRGRWPEAADEIPYYPVFPKDNSI